MRRAAGRGVVKGSGKTVLAQAKHEIYNPLILRRPGGGEFVEILAQHLVQLCAAWADPFQAAHPNVVGDEEVVERPESDRKLDICRGC